MTCEQGFLKNPGGGETYTFPNLEFGMEYGVHNSMRFTTFKLGNWNFLLVYSNIFAYILQVDHKSTSLKMLLINKLSLRAYTNF